ncbi:MAG TPA: MerR family transcriptional regulator [Rhodanobacteraceae bacterium]|nr:MerR family transcriptional regulator [Rhodanobacteraceae bacterium]
MPLFTVSQLARRTGITVRTLHHYEAEGLLLPAGRSDAGYRLYGREELARLQHIVSLKALGFPLAEIRACLDADAPSLADALVRQVDRLRQGIVRQQNLLSRLERVARLVADGEAIDAETLLSSIEATTLMEKYFTPEQMQTIRDHGAALGAERIRAVEEEWPGVIAGMQAAMALGKDPASEEVQALARRWRALVRAFTGGDAGIQRSMGTMYRENADEMRAKTGIDPALMEYACSAIASLPKD